MCCFTDNALDNVFPTIDGEYHFLLTSKMWPNQVLGIPYHSIPVNSDVEVYCGDLSGTDTESYYFEDYCDYVGVFSQICTTINGTRPCAEGPGVLSVLCRHWKLLSILERSLAMKALLGTNTEVPGF